MKLTKEELQKVQEVNTAVQTFKLKLGEIELHKVALLDRVRLAQKEFEELEQFLADKYGSDAVIDIKTGEIKHNGKD